MRRAQTLGGFLLLVVIATGGAGCESTPRGVENGGSSGATENIPSEAVYSSGYWARHDVPSLGGSGIRRVVVTDFSVEFVTGRYEKRDASDEPLATETSFGDRTLRVIPEQLYTTFAQHLRAFRIEVPPRKDVTASAAYARYETGSEAESGSPGPSDTDVGRIRSTRTIPARGLGPITGGQDGEIEEIDAALLDELKADVVVRARFRIGVFEGRATVESGSVVTLTSKSVLGSITAIKSMLSDKSALVDAGSEPVEGVYQVDHDRFSLIMRFLFDRSLKLALEELH